MGYWSTFHLIRIFFCIQFEHEAATSPYSLTLVLLRPSLTHRHHNNKHLGEDCAVEGFIKDLSLPLSNHGINSGTILWGGGGGVRLKNMSADSLN